MSQEDRYANDLDCMVTAMKILSPSDPMPINRRTVTDVFLRWVGNIWEKPPDQQRCRRAVSEMTIAYDSKIEPLPPTAEEMIPEETGFVKYGRNEQGEVVPVGITHID